MISFFNSTDELLMGVPNCASPIERGLDAMLIVYSLLNKHPASEICEQFIRNHTGWFTTTFTLFEAKSILTKIYTVDSNLASQKLAQLTECPISVIGVDLTMALAAMNIADDLGIDLTDAVLLQTALTQKASYLATDDDKLAKACQMVSITSENPISSDLRKQMVEWEFANLPTKGLPRILRTIYHWLSQSHLSAAQDFWSRTGGGSHLP